MIDDWGLGIRFGIMVETNVRFSFSRRIEVDQKERKKRKILTDSDVVTNDGRSVVVRAKGLESLINDSTVLNVCVSTNPHHFDIT